MDMRNVAVGVVMEVIATTMVQPMAEEEATLPTLGHDNTAIVQICPQMDGGMGSALDVSSPLRVTTADNSGLIFLTEPCEGSTSPQAGTAIAA